MKKTIIAGFTVLFFGIIVFAGWKYFLVNRTKQELERRVDGFSMVERLEYESLSVGIWGDWLSLSNVYLNLKGIEETITAKEIFIPHYKMENNHLVSMEVNIEGVSFFGKDLFAQKPYSLSHAPQSSQVISNITFAYRHDPFGRKIALENLAIKAPERAELFADIRLANIDPSIFAMHDISNLLLYLLGVSISETHISYNDHSLIEKMLSAENTHPESAFPAFLKVVSENVYQMLQEDQDKKTKTALEQILVFLDDPRKIHITLSPPKPVPIGRILWVRDFGKVIQMLNVQVET